MFQRKQGKQGVKLCNFKKETHSLVVVWFFDMNMNKESMHAKYMVPGLYQARETDFSNAGIW